ncbi:MAG TPA: MarR family transcriptional regulator [Acidimicrobiales bacterium]|nr:MarR family transcriptional regulator [Acidimicrobiales bacterium]
MTAPTPTPTPTPAQDALVDLEMVSRMRLSVLRLSRRLRQNAAAGLTASQLALLSTLDRRGAMTLGDLAAHEGVQPPSVTRMVDALEKAGLVKRVDSVTDRRAVMAQLTGKGRKAMEDVRRRRDAWLAERMARLTPEEQDLLEAALPVLEALAEDRRPQAAEAGKGEGR